MSRLRVVLAYLRTPSGRRLAQVGVSIVIALAGFGTYVLVIPNPGGGTPLRTVTLGGPHGTPTTKVEVPMAAVKQAARLEDHLRSENPAGVSNQVLDKAQAYQEKLAANDQLPIVTPDAAPSQRGCTTKLVQNFSSRRGVAPREFVLHWTGSSAPGWTGVWAIVGLFDRPSFAASSNYVLGALGQCAYIVRESDKAWTQAAANPFSISVEVQNPGSGIGPYLQPAGWHQLVVIASDALDRWKIPLQRGVVRNCIPVVPGITDHVSLGACGGGHPDISTHYPQAIAQLIHDVRIFRASTTKPRPVLYRIVAWRPGKVRKITTVVPGRRVAALSKHGYVRISVVRVPRP